MKKSLTTTIPLLIWAVALSFIIWQSWPKAGQGLGVDYFKALPVQQSGRVKPLDTVARTALLSFSGKQTLKLDNGNTLEAATWLLIVATQPRLADTFPIFRIDHPELTSLMHAHEGQKYFSFNDLLPHFEALQLAFRGLPENAATENAYEKALGLLHKNLSYYHHLVHSFRPFSENASDTLLEYSAWQATVGPGIQAIQAQSQNKPFDADTLERFMVLADRYLELSKNELLGLVPPSAGLPNDEGKWANVGQALLDTIIRQTIDPILWGYAELAAAAEAKDGALFGKALDTLSNGLEAAYAPWRLKMEVLFNQLMPFYQAMGLYVLSLTLICLSWLFGRSFLEKPAQGIMAFAFIIHTLGIITRMVLQGRPPVTSLYASALFVGWAAALLSLGIERIYKNGLGVAVGSIVGFATLLIAHHLSAGEDTLEMVRAVLDANFWLSTHVVMVTLGYSAMFLAGALATVYVLRRCFTHSLDRQTAESLTRMVYGTLCFALLFSFIGTLLGGIWADQSWGRFWGWDPKENGALLIVLWGALVLHARMAGIMAERGLILAALFGNILTSWSWFGTNMLGVGLHSYGFMDAAFIALMGFILSQLILMALGCLPSLRAKRKAN